MLATSKNVPLSGHNHLLTTRTDDPALLIIDRAPESRQHQWLAGGYDLEIGHVRNGQHCSYLVDSGFLV